MPLLTAFPCPPKKKIYLKKIIRYLDISEYIENIKKSTNLRYTFPKIFDQYNPSCETMKCPEKTQTGKRGTVKYPEADSNLEPLFLATATKLVA